MDEGTHRLTGVDLHWIPLGAGDHIVRVSGKLYEALKGISEHRPRTDLYHSALEVTLLGERSIIESSRISAEANAVSWPKGRSGCGGSVDSGCSATRSVLGPVVRSPTSGTRWRARSEYPQTSCTPNGSSSWSLASRRRCGVGTSWRPGICGTRTPWFPGSSRERASRPPRYAHRSAAELRVGKQDSSSQRAKSGRALCERVGWRADGGQIL